EHDLGSDCEFEGSIRGFGKVVKLPGNPCIKLRDGAGQLGEHRIISCSRNAVRRRQGEPESINRRFEVLVDYTVEFGAHIVEKMPLAYGIENVNEAGIPFLAEHASEVDHREGLS